MPDMRVLSWNLFHARDGFPGLGPSLRSILLKRPELGPDGRLHVNRKLVDEMAGVLARAEPTIALLQEVPPLAIPALAEATGMRPAWARTGPLVGPAGLRGRLGARNPDLWRTHEGNANLILVRSDWHLPDAPVRRLRLNPLRVAVPAARRAGLGAARLLDWASEARTLVATEVAPPGGPRLLVGCVHCTTDRRVSDVEVGRLAERLSAWAGDRPLVLGGDLNLPPDHPALDALADVGLRQDVPDAGIDHIYGRGVGSGTSGRRWEPEEREVDLSWRGASGRVRLSDHDPVEVTYRLPG